jgi:ribose transport system permease protein
MLETPTTPASRPDRVVTGRRFSLRRVGGMLSVRNIGAIYVLVLIVILFTIVSPDAFPTTRTAKSILNQYAITGMVALSVIVPLAAGVYDLSIGAIVAFAGVLAAYVLQHSAVSPVIAGVLVVLACAVIGLFNAFVVTQLQVNSFITTLGTGAIITALTSAVSGDETITGRIGDSFSKLATTSWQGISIAVIYLLAIMLALAYWTERTESGRQVYATGFDPETARLAGVPVTKTIVLSFLTSAVLSGFAGLVLSAQVAAGSPDIGASYLIPAFSAAFLGATQIRGGRFNAWGTVIGVMVLGTGDVALLVSGGPSWTPSLFQGCVLIAAVALSASRDGSQARARWSRLRNRRTSS